MQFQLLHVIPDPRAHGLYGLCEVIESVRWGLSELGHTVTSRVNQLANGATNIVFGFQMLLPEVLEKLPEDTVVYNLDQMANCEPSQLRPEVAVAARRLRIWDYSEANIAAWKKFSPRYEPVHVPIGWAPTLERIPKADRYDFDVLFYGGPSTSRLKVFAEIMNTGCRAGYVCGVYGEARDQLVARSKIVLNLNRYSSRVFEIVRVSYLLGNGKAVVSDIYPETVVDEEMREAVAFAAIDEVGAKCVEILADERARERLEKKGLEVMRKRDVRGIISKALEETQETRASLK
jgi:hypothetical protein